MLSLVVSEQFTSVERNIICQIYAGIYISSSLWSASCVRVVSIVPGREEEEMTGRQSIIWDYSMRLWIRQPKPCSWYWNLIRFYDHFYFSVARGGVGVGWRGIAYRLVVLTLTGAVVLYATAFSSSSSHSNEYFRDITEMWKDKRKTIKSFDRNTV